MIGPMTMLVVGVLGILFIVGIALIRKSAQGGVGGKQPCPHCTTRNPKRAKFCGSCGAPLP